MKKDAKLVSRMHSGMENYNESSCHGSITLPEQTTNCERYATAAVRHDAFTGP